MQRIFCTLALLSVCFIVGCGDRVVIKGTAEMEDGTPLTKGIITFRNDAGQYQADIKPDGTFSPGKFKDGDGIAPGVYQIGIEVFSGSPPPVVASGSGGSPPPPPSSPIHSKYVQPSTSGLTLDTSKTKTLNLVLDPAE